MHKFPRAMLTLLLPFSAFFTLAADPPSGGTFTKKSFAVKGSFQITVVAGKKFLEIDSDFKTKSGPDLQWVFSPLPLTRANGKNAMDGAVSLGPLKSNKGAQSYELPPDLDLSKMKSLLLHCVKYSKLWAGAPLP